MIQPVDLQLAHFNVERTAQISKDAIAAAQQTGQGKEVVEESVRRAQIVQAGMAAAEPQKVKRREEDEERERRRNRQGNSFSSRPGLPEEDADTEPVEIEEKKAPKKGFELYA
jgi:hypothetical protein